MTVVIRSDTFFANKPDSSEKPSKTWFNLLAGGGPSLSDEEAFLTILIGAARADGVVSPEESSELAALTARTRTLANLSVARVSDLRRQIDEKIDREGLGSALAAACHTVLNTKIGSDMARMRAESVFAHAVDIVFADRQVNQREQVYIEALAAHLDIGDDRGKAIVSIIEIKNSF